MKETTVKLSLGELTIIHALVYLKIEENKQFIRLGEMSKLDMSDCINTNDVLEGINKKVESACVKLYEP